jgi:hypothetical protein
MGRGHTAGMIFRLLRIFMLRFLPRRMFAFLTVIEFVLMARKMYRSATSTTAPRPPKTVLKPVDGNDFDDTETVDPVVIEGTSRRV